MIEQLGFDHCLTFINCQLRPAGAQHPEGLARIKPAITLCRQTGSGAYTVAGKLAAYLQARVPGPCPWTIFDKNLVDKVLEDHHLPKRIAQFMAEDRRSELADMIEELLGLHPPSWTLVRQTAETILHLADMGFVILVGRGANVITRKLPHVFHVRMVGSLEQRTAHIQEVNRLDAAAALDLIEKEDAGRRRYYKEYFNANVDDPRLYHLQVNTDLVSYDEAAWLIGEAVIHRFQLAPGATAPPEGSIY